MASYTKQLLSGSTNGKQISVYSGGTVTLHTAVAGASSLDEIYLYATNPGSSDAVITVLWGGVALGNQTLATVTAQAGRVLLMDGMLLQNGLTVQAYASTGTVSVDGFVNRIV